MPERELLVALTELGRAEIECSCGMGSITFDLNNYPKKRLMREGDIVETSCPHCSKVLVSRLPQIAFRWKEFCDEFGGKRLVFRIKSQAEPVLAAPEGVLTSGA